MTRIFLENIIFSPAQLDAAVALIKLLCNTQQHFSNQNASKTINTVKPSMKDHPYDRPSTSLIKTHLKLFCIQISMCKTTFKTTIFPLNCSCIRPRFWKPFYPFKATFLGRVFHCTGFLLPFWGGCSTVLDSCFLFGEGVPLYWIPASFLGRVFHCTGFLLPFWGGCSTVLDSCFLFGEGVPLYWIPASFLGRVFHCTGFLLPFWGGCSTVLNSCFQATFCKCDNCTSLKLLYLSKQQIRSLVSPISLVTKKVTVCPRRDMKAPTARTHSIPKS